MLLIVLRTYTCGVISHLYRNKLDVTKRGEDGPGGEGPGGRSGGELPSLPPSRLSLPLVTVLFLPISDKNIVKEDIFKTLNLYREQDSEDVEKNHVYWKKMR